MYVVAVFAEPIIITVTLAKVNSSGDTGTMVKYIAHISLPA